jgi:hypothetical protein
MELTASPQTNQTSKIATYMNCHGILLQESMNLQWIYVDEYNGDEEIAWFSALLFLD